MSNRRWAVNVDKPTRTALVHGTDCQHYVGRDPKRPEDGGWEGPFGSRDEALTFALRTGTGEARNAKCCGPR